MAAMQEKIWHLAHGRQIALGKRAVIMAIVNITPDSFSDGGMLVDVPSAVGHALQAVDDGAAIIDIGGESTRPDASPVSEAEEQARVLPVIEALSSKSDVLISIDTYRPGTARLAIQAGAHIVNDVCGLQRDREIAAVAAETGAGLCIMHTGREREKLPDVIEDQFLFLTRSLEIATEAGVGRERITIDPGFGFAKDTQQNFTLMARFVELHRFGFPLLVGASRKRFLGAAVQQEVPAARDVATVATSALLRAAGADVFRVHNVAMNRDALLVADAMLAAEPGQEL